jgi:hypothetical protein
MSLSMYRAVHLCIYRSPLVELFRIMKLKLRLHAAANLAVEILVAVMSGISTVFDIIIEYSAELNLYINF